MLRPQRIISAIEAARLGGSGRSRQFSGADIRLNWSERLRGHGATQLHGVARGHAECRMCEHVRAEPGADFLHAVEPDPAQDGRRTKCRVDSRI
ncbi:MAG: hypothetical protein SFV15_17640 [Polyangiaceae bacterium]|nr:hypothetical protein [Polyangiaceae bacterium]